MNHYPRIARRSAFGSRMRQSGAVLVAGLVIAGMTTALGVASPAAMTLAATPPHTVAVAFGVKIATLDPDQVLFSPDLNALHLIGGNLFEERGDGAIVPGLAESWRVAADQLSWVFTLRPNLRFSDGAPLSATDVAATFSRALADKANINAAVLQRVKKVSALNARTVEVFLTSPYPNLRAVLSEEGTMIMPAKRLADKGFYQAPVSAGPYRLASWGGGPTATFVLNPHYWGPKPVVREIVFDTSPDPATTLTELRAGEVDMAFDLPPSYLSTLKTVSGLFTKVVTAYGWYSLNMWNGTGPLADVELRKAISYAIDRRQLVKSVWQGRNTPLAGYWPDTMTGYDQSISAARNLGVARSHLAKSKCAKGCSLTLMYAPDALAWSDEGALLIRNDLAAIGIKVTLDRTDATTLYSNLGDGKYQLALSGLTDFVNIPDGLLPYGLSSASGVVNADFTGYHSATTQSLIARVLAATGARKQRLLSAVNARFLQDQPYATLADWAWVVASRVQPSILAFEHSGLLDVARG